MQNDTLRQTDSDAPPDSTSIRGTDDRLPIENLTRAIVENNALEPSSLWEDPAYRPFFDELSRALHRSTPRHVAVLHDKGVGERAALIEFARRGATGELPFLTEKQLLFLDSRYLNFRDFQTLVEGQFMAIPIATRAILCIDGAANLFRFFGSKDGRTVLLSALARTRCRLIALLSPNEAEELVRGDPELSDLFSTVHLPEPEPLTATALVQRFAAGLETHYQVRIGGEAIRLAVTLSDSYIMHERLPHKAVKILQSVCDDVAYDRSQLGLERSEITGAQVVAKISQMTGVPGSTLSGVGESVDYQDSLGDIIVGQPHAVAEVATELGLIKTGMSDPGKPASVMMFIGQTGTGKTELAKALAQLYSSTKRLKTFTLGNFSEPHSVSGIIGVPAGYVGHDQGGRLINELNADPYGVFLLDEADKAHPDVMQPFLNLFDEGWVADQKGIKAYANRAIFILTTNVGQRQIADLCRAGKTIEEITSAMKESLSRIRHTKSNRPVFSPEFLSRIKRFIVFRTLEQEAMVGICQRLVERMQSDWKHKRQKHLVVPASLQQAIGERAFAIDQSAQGKEGGRIVRKLIADIIESPIRAAITKRPDAYRSSPSIVIDQTSGGDASDSRAAIRVEVRFEP
jgi:ATP-dependent Clp protease ATP-binding subunit ClpC